MSEQEFALDAAGNSVQVHVLDEPEGALVGINHSFIGGIPSREALRAGQAFVLQDGSTLRVQLVENQLQVFKEGQRLLQNHYAVSPQQPYDQPQAYYEYAAPPQGPYGAFPYQQPVYFYGTPPAQATRLPQRGKKPALSSFGQQRLVQHKQPLYTVEDLTAVRLSRREVLVGLTGLVAAVLSGGGLALLTRSKRPTSPIHALVSLQTPTPYILGTYLYTTYRNHHDEVRSVSWSPQGQRIASASADKTVQIWNAENGVTFYTYTGHTGPVNAVAWSPDGKRIASASADFTVHVWDATNGGHVYTYTGHTEPVFAVAWSPDGTRIASAGEDETVQVWDAVDGRLAYTYTGHSGGVNAAAWAPDSKRIASASFDATVRIWNALDGSNSFTYPGHTSFVYAVAWSPDGTRIASASRDQTVQVWRAK